MHPDRDDLLALRDGRGDPRWVDHAATCPVCAATLENLDATASALRRLPELRPPSDGWPALRERLREPAAMIRVAAGWAAILFVLLASSFLILMRQPSQAPESEALQKEKAALRERIGPLKARSHALEKSLSAYQSRSRVLSGRVAGTMATIEDGLAIVDLQLSLLQKQDTEPDKLVRLWEERIKLLGALVELNAPRSTATPI